MQANDKKQIKDHIFKLVAEYYQGHHRGREFDPGKDVVRYAGRVFDENELIKLVESALDFWLTEGRFSEEFSEKISDFLGISNVILTNSGSSSNLLAFAALTSDKLESRKLNPGDEVISAAAAFPATVTPIIQYGMTPVFIDVDIPTYNIKVDMLDRALSGKTRAIFLAHTLGNPFDVDAVLEFARRNNLWVIEDNCDAFGSKYRNKYTGTFGHVSSLSFYPAHHITTGEGGAVVTDDDELAKIIRSFRDWGRDCYCMSGENDTCGKRFTQQFGDLPLGFDHKYVYSELGYNLKMTDLQASIGSVQMDKLEGFCELRKQNFNAYTKGLLEFAEFFILPEKTDGADPAWFSYIITVRENAPFTRNQLVQFLNVNRVETRNIFAGNIIKQPAFRKMKYRIAGGLENTDIIMNNTFFLGTYPGMSEEMIKYTVSCIGDFIGNYK
jgi:CDP-6-deoxy-D-xylo-4-hexulose-3-dehydrase